MIREITDRNDVIPILGELFREYGFSGTSLSQITERTNLGKGSLYHFFPKGKKEMAEAVLNDIETWFQDNVFVPLRNSEDPKEGIDAMFKEVNNYFLSGNRICLVGAFALDNTRDQFSEKVSAYFLEWIEALTSALKKVGFPLSEAKIIAEDTVVHIQGALVLARAKDEPKLFKRAIKRLQKRVIYDASE
jgi:AcrR family transcriptional regulator